MNTIAPPVTIQFAACRQAFTWQANTNFSVLLFQEI
jgi:hypothetical protein